MTTKKKDLEIIYSLQWKNKPGNGKDKANIIGMYDIPATTLNWEVFKSYLLKNSGTVGDDVKVAYITDSNREFPIESQTDFQIALYAFRRKARMGRTVNLKLDRISENSDGVSHKNMRHSNDVETQFDNEAASVTSTCCHSDSPPEWFMLYMSQFKKNITEEVVASVTNVVANMRPHTVSQPPCYHSKKYKGECSKRIRKLQPLIVDTTHEAKDLVKSLKLEGKMERKLKKLEHEAKKKEKKLVKLLKSSDSDVGGQSSGGGRSRGEREDLDEDLAAVLQMDAAPVKEQTAIPHMLGGEVYLHQWQVKNIGKLCWTSKTCLMFTWGSKALKPLDTVVSVPYLHPGEIGVVSVRLQIPSEPGQYECYWHFHHKERRFGHWLGCQVIVDAFDLKGNRSVLETTPLAPANIHVKLEESVDELNPVTEYGNTSTPQKEYNNKWYNCTTDVMDEHSGVVQGPSTSQSCKYTFDVKSSEYNNIEKEPDSLSKQSYDKLVRDISTGVEQIKLQDPTDTNCSSDSDNQSLISLSESNDSKELKEEFVLVPIPSCFKIDAPATEVKEENVTVAEPTTSERKDDNNNGDVVDHNKKDDSGSEKSDIVVVTLSNDHLQDEEFVYVVVDGKKLPIPKKMIKDEYLVDVPSRTNSVASSIEVVGKGDKSDENAQVEVTGNAQAEATDSTDTNVFNSHSSKMAARYSETVAERNARLFIFPQSCPGYEVVHPTTESQAAEPEPTVPEYHWANSATSYSYTPAADLPSAPTEHVPNYQQTPPEERPQQPTFEQIAAEANNPSDAPGTSTPPDEARRGGPKERPIQILPEGLVSGTLNVASSAINTARQVINRIVPNEPLSEPPATSTNERPSSEQPRPGYWQNGHWVSTDPTATREANLQALAEMGFWNRDLNATLLARYEDDLSRVVAELVQ